MNYDMNQTDNLIKKLKGVTLKALEESNRDSLASVEEVLLELSGASMLGSFYAGQLRTIISTNPSKEYLEGYLESTRHAMNFDNGFSL